MIGHAHDPVFEPALKIFEFATLRVVLGEKLVIAAVVPLNRRGVGAAGLVNYGGDEKTRDERAVRIRGNQFRRYDLFRDDNYLPCGSRSVYGDTKTAPNMGIAEFIGALHLQDRDIGTKRANGDEFIFVDRRDELAQIAIFPEQIAAKGGVRR